MSSGSSNLRIGVDPRYERAIFAISIFWLFQTTLPYAPLRATLKRLGRPIPANDTWIAALAMQHGLPILSRDEHFDA